MKNEIKQLLIDQLSVWETARNNYEALKQVKTKELDVNGAKFKVQFNPARIVSSGAKVDAKSIQERKCFLCAENRPKVQEGIEFNPTQPPQRGGDYRISNIFTNNEFLLQNPPFGGRGGYTILINPFPIFPKHFTIPDVEHVPQLILGRFGDMLDLAEKMDDYLIFYNGPKCGASAPDHVHFQAGNKGFLPIEKEWRNHIVEKINDSLFAVNYGFPTFVIETTEKEECVQIFEKIYQNLEIKEGEDEPMMNILAWFEGNKYVAVVIPRAKHRPDCYFADGEKNILISPASVDLGGVFITPLEKDFEKISAENVAEILGEVCLDEREFSPLTP